MAHLLLLNLLAASSGKSKSSSGLGSSLPILILIVLAGAYFVFIRPRSRRMRQQQQSTTTIEVGDEVISAGGILGTVTAVAGDEIVVEVSPGTNLTFWRRAINLRTAVKGAPQSTSGNHEDLEEEPADFDDDYFEDEDEGDAEVEDDAEAEDDEDEDAGDEVPDEDEDDDGGGDQADGEATPETTFGGEGAPGGSGEDR